MGLTVRLGGSAGTVFATAHVGARELKCLPHCTRVVNDKGKTEAFDYAIELEGNVVTSPAATVGEAYFDLVEEITTQGARQVEIIVDSTTLLDLNPTSCYWGPFVSEVRPIDDEGNFDGHMRWAMTIRARVKASSAAYEIDTSLRDVTNVDGKIVRKVWRATAKAKTADLAWAAVLAFKPSGGSITQDRVRWFEQTRVEVEWVWEAERKVGGQKVKTWT